MLFVIEVSWKPDKTDEIWKRFAERKVPQHEDVKIIEAYYIPGKNRSVAIVEAPSEVAIAQATMNYERVSESKSYPAIPAREYLKMREELLK